jgi:hypothetical protein
MSQRSIFSKNGSVSFVIDSKFIFEMLKLPQNLESEILNERVLAECFKGLSYHDKTSLIKSYLCQNINLPGNNVNLKIDMSP